MIPKPAVRRVDMENANFEQAARDTLAELDRRIAKPNRLDALNLAFSGAMLDFAAIQSYGWQDLTLDSKGERHLWKGGIALKREIGNCVFVLIVSPFQREDDESDEWHYCFFKEGDDERYKAGELKAYVRCWAIRLDLVDEQDGVYDMDDVAGDKVGESTLAVIRRELDGSIVEFPRSFLADIYAISHGIRPPDAELLARDDINEAAEDFAEFLLNEADRASYSAIRFVYSYMRALVFPERDSASVEALSRVYCSYFFLAVFFVTTDFFPCASRLSMLVIKDTLQRFLGDGIQFEPDDIAFFARALTRARLPHLAMEAWDEHFERRADLEPFKEKDDEKDDADDDVNTDSSIEDDDALPFDQDDEVSGWDFGWDDEEEDKHNEEDDSYSFNPDSAEEHEKRYKESMSQELRIREFWESILSFIHASADDVRDTRVFPPPAAARALDMLAKYAPYFPKNRDFPREELETLLHRALHPSSQPLQEIIDRVSDFCLRSVETIESRRSLKLGPFDPAVDEPLMWMCLECNGADDLVLRALRVFPTIPYEDVDPENPRRIPSRILLGISQSDIWAFAANLGPKRLAQIMRDVEKNSHTKIPFPYNPGFGQHTIDNQNRTSLCFIPATSSAGVDIAVYISTPRSCPNVIYPEFFFVAEPPEPNIDCYVTRLMQYRDGIGGELEILSAESRYADFDCISAFAPRFQMVSQSLVRNVVYSAYLCAQVVSIADPKKCMSTSVSRAKFRFQNCSRDNRIDKKNWKCAMTELDCEDKSRAVYDICGIIKSVSVHKIHKAGWIYKLTIFMNGCIPCDLPVYVHPAKLISQPRCGTYFAARVIMNISIACPPNIAEYQEMIHSPYGPWDEEMEPDLRPHDFERIPAQRLLDPVEYTESLLTLSDGSISKVLSHPWSAPFEVVSVENFNYRGNALYQLREIYGWRQTFLWGDNPYGIDISVVDEKGGFIYWHVSYATPKNPNPALHPNLRNIIVRVGEKENGYREIKYEIVGAPEEAG